jgi:hypothetical protein
MKEPLEYTYSPRIFGQPYGELSDELQEYARRMAAIVEENQFRAFNEGRESVRAQAKAEKVPDAHPYAWAIKGPGIKAEKVEIRNPGADLVDLEEDVRSAARREAFEALRGIMKDGDNHDRILACRAVLETNQW